MSHARAAEALPSVIGGGGTRKRAAQAQQLQHG